MKPPIHFASCLLAIVLTTTPAPSQSGWVAQTSGTSHHLFGIHFVDDLTGWVVGGTDPGGGFVILHTSDGGVNWVTQITGNGSVLYDVYFVDEMNGWAAGEAGTILHTTNGGSTWNPQTSNDPHNLSGVEFVDANNGWIGGDWSTLLHTTNGGTTWTQQSIGSTRALEDLEFLNSNTGWAGGNFGDIFHTTNGGSTWVQQTTGTTQDLQAPSLPDLQNGWAVGGNHGAGGGQVILHTTDGGLTWNPLSTGTSNNLLDVVFLDQNLGWAVGGWYADDESIILHTTDGGNTWGIQSIGTTQFLRRIFLISETTGWAVGSEGTILHTNTGGIPYPALQEPVAYYPFNGNANDESGNDRHGTVFGASLTVDRFGQSNSAYYFDGDSSYIKADGIGLPTADRTVSMWFFAASPLERPNALAYGGSVCGHSWMQGINIWGSQGYTVTSHCSLKRLTVPYPADPVDEWHHWVVTVDPSGTSMYLDGLFVGSDDVYFDDTHTFQGNLAFGTAVNHQGYAPHADDNHYWFVGSLDDIRIYNRALSDSEILALYNESLDPLAQPGVFYGSTGNVEPNNPGALISIDPLTGAGTLIGPTGIIGDDGPAVRALAIKSTGEMYAMSHTASSDLYSVNASTGAGTFVANTGLLHPGDICFNAEDVLYAVDDTNILYTIDETTGVRTVVGATGIALAGLAYDPTDGTMYGSGAADDIYTIDLETGAVTLVGTTGIGGNTPDIHFDQAGNLFGVKRGAGGVYDYIALDKSTGTGTLIGSTGFVAVVGLATRLEPPSAIPCGDITNFQTRCRAGGTIQARLTLANMNYTGEIVEFSIDGSPYQVTVGANGRANLSVGVFDLGLHTVEVTNPAGCVDPVTVRCRSGVAMEGDDLWNDEEVSEIPVTTLLIGNYPNPFNPSTTFRYALAEPGQVSLRVYNMLGQMVRTVVDESHVEGYHEALWDGRNESGATVASGIYVYRMIAGSFVEMRKLILMK